MRLAKRNGCPIVLCQPQAQLPVCTCSPACANWPQRSSLLARFGETAADAIVTTEVLNQQSGLPNASEHSFAPLTMPHQGRSKLDRSG